MLATSMAVALAGTVWLDGRVRPANSRSGFGAMVAGLQAAVLFGVLVTMTGQPPLSAAIALAAVAALVIASNAKRRLLGEPLLFSDLALVGALFRHPQFYLSALNPGQRLAGLVAALALIALVFLTIDLRLAPRLAGLGIAAVAALGLRFARRQRPSAQIGLDTDATRGVARHGLLSTLYLNWHHWRQAPDPPACRPQPPHCVDPDWQLLVVVQCESFADPAILFGDHRPLPNLAAARRDAWQAGRLLVSGFGAYTMRTEYAVIFGRDEAELGLRRFDPYLTALGEASYGLPARLAPSGWHSLFVHPHDLRFYGRDRIMPACGFAEMIGPARFAPPATGRYVHDAVLARHLLALAAAAEQPTLLYAVTMENHGPWAADPNAGTTAVDAYRIGVERSDAMLGTLREGLAALGRPALLVFFGDHRPSIPGATNPEGDRDTPYVILRIGADGWHSGDGQPTDVTPAGLHHAVLAALAASPAPAPAKGDRAAASAAADPASAAPRMARE